MEAQDVLADQVQALAAPLPEGPVEILAVAATGSGVATGAPPDGRQLAEVRAAVPEARLLAGSGASVDTIRAILEYANGAIVGTAIKVDGQTIAPVDPDEAREFVKVARS